MVRERSANENNHQWKDIDKNLFIDYYCIQKLSIAKTAEMLGVDRRLVRRRLKYWGITSRSYEEQYKIESDMGRLIEAHRHQIVEGSQKRNRKNYLRIAKENFEWKCMVCGKTQTSEHFDLVVHHKDGDNMNNNVENLMILCQGCHCQQHEFGASQN